ncbi:unnamed protein product [Cuscuta campestris]|uniref:Uncharacterized protein n=1 Tax=Cuscuta campestris TaxID=132261 RepID=A0A484LPC3_9ASTE|nr:unnamed protein product [Cuscuta campestris]
MAVVLCSDNSFSSPRISFSHDLRESDAVPVEFHRRCLPADPFLFEPTFDFDFRAGFVQEVSPADEIFADGKILPVQIKNAGTATPRQPSPAPANADQSKKMLKELLSANPEPEEEYPGTPVKHFWQFRRSKSTGNGLVRSLQFLSRSKSTGSAPNPKPPVRAPPPPEYFPKQGSRPEPFLARSVSSILFKKTINGGNTPLKKSRSCRSAGNGGARISPVLNITSKHAFFGLGSLFCNGKSKSKKRWAI